MMKYFKYIILSIITTSLSSTYLNMIHQKNINSITDELKLQYEENKKLRKEIKSSSTMTTILKDMDNSLELLLKKVQEFKNPSIDESVLQKINETCNQILQMLHEEEEEEEEEKKIVSTFSTESFDTLNEVI